MRQPFVSGPTGIALKPFDVVPNKANCTGHPALASKRATTKPSPPLLPGPHSTNTGLETTVSPAHRKRPALRAPSNRCSGYQRRWSEHQPAPSGPHSKLHVSVLHRNQCVILSLSRCTTMTQMLPTMRPLFQQRTERISMAKQRSRRLARSSTLANFQEFGLALQNRHYQGGQQ